MAVFSVVVIALAADRVLVSQQPPSNDALGVDWRVLAGSQVRSATKGENGVSVTWLDTYSVSGSTQGDTAFEFHSAQLVKLHRDLYYRADSRAKLPLSMTSVRTTFRVAGPGDQTITFELDIDSGAVVFDSADTRATGVVPKGTLPRLLHAAAIAALPDSLPASIELWLLDRNSWPAQARAVRFDFGRHEQIKVPLAR